MKFSRYNLVLFEKGTDKPILFNTFTGNTFFLSYEALDSIKKNDIRLWIAAAANCFLVLALSLKTLLMNYDIFHILTIETNIFQKCFPQLLY